MLFKTKPHLKGTKINENLLRMDTTMYMIVLFLSFFHGEMHQLKIMNPKSLLRLAGHTHRIKCKTKHFWIRMKTISDLLLSTHETIKPIKN